MGMNWKWFGLGALVILFGALLWYVRPEQIFELSGTPGKLLFLLINIGEIIVAPIPGGLIGFLAAARWGFWDVWPLIYLGNVIGGMIVFILARELGSKWAHDKIGEQTYNKLQQRIDKGVGWVWLTYAIPILPIDMLSIALGMSAMKKRTFFLILATALPFYSGIVAYLGAYAGKYIPFIEQASLVAILLLVLGGILVYLKKKKR